MALADEFRVNYAVQYLVAYYKQTIYSAKLERNMGKAKQESIFTRKFKAVLQQAVKFCLK